MYIHTSLPYRRARRSKPTIESPILLPSAAAQYIYSGGYNDSGTVAVHTYMYIHIKGMYLVRTSTRGRRPSAVPGAAGNTGVGPGWRECAKCIYVYLGTLYVSTPTYLDERTGAVWLWEQDMER